MSMEFVNTLERFHFLVKDTNLHFQGDEIHNGENPVWCGTKRGKEINSSNNESRAWVELKKKECIPFAAVVLQKLFEAGM